MAKLAVLLLSILAIPAAQFQDIRVSGVDYPFPVRILWSPDSTVIEVQYEARVIEITIINSRENWAMKLDQNLYSGMQIDVVRVSGGPLDVYLISDEKLSAVVRGIEPPY